MFLSFLLEIPATPLLCCTAFPDPALFFLRPPRLVRKGTPVQVVRGPNPAANHRERCGAHHGRHGGHEGKSESSVCWGLRIVCHVTVIATFKHAWRGEARAFCSRRFLVWGCERTFSCTRMCQRGHTYTRILHFCNGTNEVWRAWLK